MNRTLFCLPLLFSLALGAQEAPAPQPPACPDPSGHGMPGHGPMRHDMEPGARMARALNLSADQQARIKEIHAKRQTELKQKREAAQEAAKAFHEAMRAADTPADKLRALHQALSDRHFDLLLLHRAQRQEVDAVLTPEQREKAAALRGRMMEHRRPGMGMGKGPEGRRGGRR